MRKQQLKRCALSGLLCLSVLTLSTVSIAGNVTIGRYLSVPAKPQIDQQQLLQQQIQVKYPQNILTIQQAVSFTLQFSGYRLANTMFMNLSAREMLKQPLPEVNRIFEPMTLQQALTTLAGKAFYLLIDPVHRLVAYKVKPAYRSLYRS